MSKPPTTAKGTTMKLANLNMIVNAAGEAVGYMNWVPTGTVGIVETGHWALGAGEDVHAHAELDLSTYDYEVTPVFYPGAPSDRVANLAEVVKRVFGPAAKVYGN